MLARRRFIHLDNAELMYRPLRECHSAEMGGRAQAWSEQFNQAGQTTTNTRLGSEVINQDRHRL